MITENIKKILSRIPDWTITSVAAILPGLFSRYGIESAIGALVLSYLFSLYVLHLQLSKPIDFKSDNSTKKQFEVFDLLSKWQKRRIKSYFRFSLWSLFVIPIWLFTIILFDRMKIIKIVNTEWYIIPFFLSILVLYSSFYVYKIYIHTINFHDSDIPQILWSYIEELIEQHGSKEGELKEQLGEDGDKQLLYVLGKRKEGKIPTNLLKEDFENVLEAEVAIIEILKSNDPDIKKVCERVKSLSTADKKHLVKNERTKNKKL